MKRTKKPQNAKKKMLGLIFKLGEIEIAKNMPVKIWLHGNIKSRGQ